MIYLNQNEVISFAEWHEIIKQLQLERKLLSADTIVIKPNFAAGSYVDPKSHVITNLELLSSTINYVATVNDKANIYIGESDSTGYGFAFLKFEHLNIPNCLKINDEYRDRIKLLDLSRDKLKKVEKDSFLLYHNIDKQLWLSETLLNSDFTISLSNLKTHSVTGYTGACKNLFGCLPDTDKSCYHPRIHKVIHDLVLAINPDLNIIDAFCGMQTNGPVQGEDVNSGYRVFSNNALEADIYASSTIGFYPSKVKYIRYLAKTNGVTLNHSAKIIKKYKKPYLFLRIMNSIGLFIQGAGQVISDFGHRIHSCPTFINLVITIFRPLLLAFIDYEKLKEWKRRLLK